MEKRQKLHQREMVRIWIALLHQEKPEHVCVLVFLFVSTMEGARTGRRRVAPQAISPVGCCLARGSQSSGMSTKKAPPAGAPFAEPRFMQYRTGTMYVRAIRKKQRQGITMVAVSCLLLYGAFRGNRCVRRKKGQALTYRGVLSVCGMV